MKICLVGNLTSIHFYRNILSIKNLVTNILIINCGIERWGKLPENYSVINIPKNIIGDFKSMLFWIKKEIDAFKPDLIHTHAAFDIGYVALFINEYPKIITYQDGLQLFDESLHYAEKDMVTFSQKSADAFILATFSEQLKDRFQKRGFKRDQTYYLPFYSDSEYFKKNENDLYLDQLKKELKIQKNDIVLFSSRAPSIPASVDIIAKSIDKICNKHGKNIKFIFAGHGYDIHSIGNMASIFNNIKNKDKVRWLGFIDKKRILRALYQISDIYISLFCDYGFSPVSLKEALLCKSIPIIGEHHGDNFWIKNGENGFIIKQRNLEELINSSNKAIELIKQQKHKDILIKNKRMVLERFDYKKFGSEFMKIYKNVLKNYKKKKLRFNYKIGELYYQRNNNNIFMKDKVIESDEIQIETFKYNKYLTKNNPTPIDASSIIKLLAFWYMNKGEKKHAKYIVKNLKKLGNDLDYDYNYLAKRFFAYCRRFNRAELFLDFTRYFQEPSIDMIGNHLYSFEYYKNTNKKKSEFFRKIVLNSIDQMEHSILSDCFVKFIKIYKERTGSFSGRKK